MEKSQYYCDFCRIFDGLWTPPSSGTNEMNTVQEWTLKTVTIVQFKGFLMMWRQIWRHIPAFFKYFRKGIQKFVVTYWPLSGFIPPALMWQSCFCISNVSLTFLLNLLWITATVSAPSKFISPGQVLLWRATPDFSYSSFSTLVLCSPILVSIFFLVSPR